MKYVFFFILYDAFNREAPCVRKKMFNREREQIHKKKIYRCIHTHYVTNIAKIDIL